LAVLSCYRVDVLAVQAKTRATKQGPRGSERQNWERQDERPAAMHTHTYTYTMPHCQREVERRRKNKNSRLPLTTDANPATVDRAER